MDRVATSPKFSFHLKCKREAITHLSFADVVLIFTKDNRDSLTLVKKGLELFQRLSGLQMSREKMNMYFRGYSDVECEDLVQFMGFCRVFASLVLMGAVCNGSAS